MQQYLGKFPLTILILYNIIESERTTKASRKFMEFWCKRVRFFVKYSCTQVNIRKSSKSYDRTKMNKKLNVTIKVVVNIEILKFALKRLNSGRGNLICLLSFLSEQMFHYFMH